MLEINALAEEESQVDDEWQKIIVSSKKFI